VDNKALRLGIISGIISSLIVVIFIHPILSLLWNVFITVAGSIHQGYVDRIYRNAALSERNLFSLVTILGLLLVAFLIISLQGYSRSKGARVLNITMFVMTLFMIITGFFAFSLAMGVMEIRASFSQRLSVLAPAIDDHEYKMFRARWASMTGLKDYNTLVSAMDTRAKELGVTLPPVRKP
jgi:hypothetical protein